MVVVVVVVVVESGGLCGKEAWKKGLKTEYDHSQPAEDGRSLFPGKCLSEGEGGREGGGGGGGG